MTQQCTHIYICTYKCNNKLGFFPRRPHYWDLLNVSKNLNIYHVCVSKQTGLTDYF